MIRPKISPRDVVAANAMLVAVRQSADVICDRWSMSVILAAYLGARRFNEFVEITGATGGLLAARLRRLEADGLVLKVPYSRRPARFEYRLTNMGEQWFEVVVEMVRWEQRWYPEPTNRILALIEKRAPGILDRLIQCAACGVALTARDVQVKVSRTQLQRMPVKRTAYRRSIINSGNAAQAPSLLGPSLDLLGDKWSIEVINCAFLGLHRFGEFRRDTGIAANILSDRLARLVGAGFLTLGDDRKGGPTPRGYWLAEQGISFYPVLLRMQDWADTWITDRYKSPVTLIHRSCGMPLRVRSIAGASAV